MTLNEAIKLLGLATNPRVTKEIELSVAPDVTDKFLEAIDMAIEALGKPEQRWIPVTERLPEDYQDVLICGEGDFITCAQLIKGIFECGEIELYGSIDGTKVIGADTFNVLAWMPLPKPWKGDAE